MTETKERKRGKFSDFEKQSLMDMVARGMSDKEIAEQLNRTEEVVRSHRVKGFASGGEEKEEINDQITVLKDKFYWPALHAQLLDDNEVVYFQNLWASLYNQFFTVSEITHTDEMMIKDLCIVDVHINRALKTKKELLEQIAVLEKDYRLCDDHIDNPIELGNEKRRLNEMIQALRAGLKSLTSEWKEMQEKKDKKFEQLKSTRQQKLELEEKSGKNFFDMLKLLDTFEKREREGYMNELIKMSADKTVKKFTQPTEFGDGEIDKVMLTPESITADYEQEKLERVKEKQNDE